MTEAEKNAVRQRIAQWERAAPVLRQVRDKEIRSADTKAAIESFHGFFQDAAKRYSPKPTSGLIEQQYWFRKLAGR